MIFNRSHYEDVLVPRVHGLIDEARWTERYALINAFERGLVAAGTSILKFFLHISRHEQLQRFRQRLEDPARNWKISESDYLERARWNDYRHAGGPTPGLPTGDRDLNPVRQQYERALEEERSRTRERP